MICDLVISLCRRENFVADIRQSNILSDMHEGSYYQKCVMHVRITETKCDTFYGAISSFLCAGQRAFRRHWNLGPSEGLQTLVKTVDLSPIWKCLWSTSKFKLFNSVCLRIVYLYIRLGIYKAINMPMGLEAVGINFRLVKQL